MYILNYFIFIFSDSMITILHYFLSFSFFFGACHAVFQCYSSPSLSLSLYLRYTFPFLLPFMIHSVLCTEQESPSEKKRKERERNNDRIYSVRYSSNTTNPRLFIMARSARSCFHCRLRRKHSNNLFNSCWFPRTP